MIIALLIILIGVLVWCAYNIYLARQDVKELEQEKENYENLITNYQRLMKEIKGRCEEGLEANVLIYSRHALKEIKASIDTLE